MIDRKVERIRRHDGLHNYKCIRCQEVFKFRSQLSRHLKNSEKCEGKGELTQYEMVNFDCIAPDKPPNETSGNEKRQQPKAGRQFNCDSGYSETLD